MSTKQDALLRQECLFI